MTKVAAVSQAVMGRMRKAIEREGLPFRGFRAYPDGSVEALVGEPDTLTDGSSEGSDPLGDELAAWRAEHGEG